MSQCFTSPNNKGNIMSNRYLAWWCERNPQKGTSIPTPVPYIFPIFHLFPVCLIYFPIFSIYFLCFPCLALTLHSNVMWQNLTFRPWKKDFLARCTISFLGWVGTWTGGPLLCRTIVKIVYNIIILTYIYILYIFIYTYLNLCIYIYTRMYVCIYIYILGTGSAFLY